MALALFKRMVTCKPNANRTARLECKIRTLSIDVYESTVVSLCLRKAVFRAMKLKSAALYNAFLKSFSQVHSSDLKFPLLAISFYDCTYI